MTESSFVKVEKLPGGQCAVCTVVFEKVGSREAPIVQQELFTAAESNQWRVVVDLSPVTLLVSMGLGALVALHKKCKETSGTLVVCGLRPELQTLLKLTHLDRVIKVVPDRAAAVQLMS